MAPGYHETVKAVFGASSSKEGVTDKYGKKGVSGQLLQRALNRSWHQNME